MWHPSDDGGRWTVELVGIVSDPYEEYDLGNPIVLKVGTTYAIKLRGDLEDADYFDGPLYTYVKSESAFANEGSDESSLPWEKLRAVRTVCHDEVRWSVLFQPDGLPLERKLRLGLARDQPDIDGERRGVAFGEAVTVVS